MTVAPALRSTPPTNRAIPWLVTLLLAAGSLLAVARVLGPSDLYDKEQPRTVAYTADMIANHHWLLPQDTFGIPATKPPLFNWLSVPFVQVAGYQEWALKIPSLFATAAVLLCLILAARHLLRRAPATSSLPAALPLLAPLLWLASPMTAKLLYLARPDMLVTATLTGAWLAATCLVQKPTRASALAYWFCILATAFAKGPSVLLALLYLPLAAKLLTGRWSVLKHSGYLWGLPLLLLSSALYAWIASRLHPEFFQQVLLGKEVAGHLAGPLQWLKTLPNGPFYMIARFLPWSLFVILMLVRIPPRKWFAHPLAPAILWLLVIALSMTFVSTKRPDRFAPAFPPMALIAAWCLQELAPRFRLAPVHIAAAALLFIAGLCVENQYFSHAARTHFGDHVLQFARTVRTHTGDDFILFADGEMTPLETLLGRNQLPTPSDETLRNARWCIDFYQPNSLAAAVSKPLFNVDDSLPDARLALYPLAPGEGPAAFRQAQLSFQSTSDPAIPDRWMQRQHRHPSFPATAPSR